MVIDTTFLTLLGILVAVSGVIATLVAPSLTKQARIYYEVDPTSRVRRDVGHGGVSITVSHGNRIITTPVYVFSVTVHNGGKKDLVATDFVDPIRISSTHPLRFMSADASAPDGVLPNVEVGDESVTLAWRILKPKESVTVRGVLTSDQDVSPREISASLSVMARLRDVQVGKPRSWPRGMALAVLAALLIIFGLGGTLLLPGIKNSPHLAYNDGREVRILVPRDDNFRDCRLLKANEWISDCRRVSVSELAERRHDFYEIRGRYGVRLFSLLALVSAAFIYSLMAGFSFSAMGRIFGSIRRLRHEP